MYTLVVPVRVLLFPFSFTLLVLEVWLWRFDSLRFVVSSCPSATARRRLAPSPLPIISVPSLLSRPPLSFPCWHVAPLCGAAVARLPLNPWWCYALVGDCMRPSPSRSLFRLVAVVPWISPPPGPVCPVLGGPAAALAIPGFRLPSAALQQCPRPPGLPFAAVVTRGYERS